MQRGLPKRWSKRGTRKSPSVKRGRIEQYYSYRSLMLCQTRRSTSSAFNVARHVILRRLTRIQREVPWKLIAYRYELRLHYEYHDDMEFRQIQKHTHATTVPNHRRASSHPLMAYPVSSSIIATNGDTTVKKIHKRKSQRLLDALSPRSLEPLLISLWKKGQANYTRNW